MNQIMDLKIYWAMGENYNFNKKNMNAQIILHPDGWIEGIVKNKKLDKYICGVYSKDKAIEFMIIKRGVKNPCVFGGKNENDDYIGYFSKLKLFGCELLGTCRIITKASEKQNSEELENKIGIWKKSMKKDYNRNLYKNAEAMREESCASIHQGDTSGYSYRERKEIEEELIRADEEAVQKNLNPDLDIEEEVLFSAEEALQKYYKREKELGGSYN